ncbi:DNA primase [Oceanimonas doudoroffii]|uniref:DNA primase n=1 Tax=Oceanimonas doudoroffii TaxID=84158 RepID=A0A233RJU5_9GAMM|nr:DNA primase [Oceanimonas doudoroffii]OXY83660.1 DNA primase [Oceanimonas doudoroffii]
MAGRIPQQFIDDLLARTDIVDLIDQRVRLKKAGKNYQACCPFHNEKSPSFTVSPDKQFYHCFGCGAHGTALGFLMEYDGLEFLDAIDELAAMHGLTVPRESTGGSSPQQQAAARAERQDLYGLLNDIARFYQQQLRNAPAAIDYLKGRGLSGEVVKRFGIGYVPDRWDGVKRQFAGNRDAERQLIDGGMLLQSDNGRIYDRFRDRVMFPIRDRRGRTIGFGGRVLGDGTPKYLNSPETPVFHKGRELYGLYEVRQAHRNPERVLVVEGYMDVVALAQFGIDYGVASLGTSTTPDQLQLLYRTTREVICCYDGDRAGREAAWRALENALPLMQDGRSLRFVFLPDGEDPDSLVRSQGKDAFERLLGNAQDFGDFLFERLAQDSMEGDAGQHELAHKAAEAIMRVPEGFTREGLVTRLSRQLNWGENERRVKELFARLKPADDKEKPAPSRPQKLKLTPLRRAIALVLQYPAAAARLPDIPALEELSLPGMELLLALLGQVREQPALSTAQLLEHWRGHPSEPALSRLAMADNAVAGDHIEQELQDIFVVLINDYLAQRIELLQQKSRSRDGLTPSEKQELVLLLTESKGGTA